MTQIRKATLFAWANPLKAAPILDHTWVTNYEIPPIHDNPPPPPKGDDYWWCWGIYHAVGSGGTHHQPYGAIGNGSANLEITRNVVTPNDQAAHGTIAYYGVDGVCHQLANQTLYTTGDRDHEPLRVSDARGYHLSTFFYKNYGLQQTAWKETVAKYAPEIRVPDDDFSAILNTLIAPSPEQLIKIEAVRLTAHTSLQAIRENITKKSPEKIHIEIAAALAVALAEMHHILGKSDFEKLFPPFDMIINGAWVDFNMVALCMNRSLDE